jgi:two-component system sensor histidine kinase/response regulator
MTRYLINGKYMQSQPRERPLIRSEPAGSEERLSDVETVEVVRSQAEAVQERGPRMARYGFLVIIIVACAGLAANLLLPSPKRTVALWFYSMELMLEVALFAVSFTEWFRRVWEVIVLGSACVLFAAMAAAAVASKDYVAVTFGLLLMQMGAAAFMPWSPSYQLSFNLASLGCIGVFTLLAPHWDPALVSFWIVLIAGAIIGQVACVSSYHYRLELDRRLDTVVAGRQRLAASRERLAAEARERERVIAQLRETQRDLTVSREAALTASRARSEFLSSMSHEIRTPMNSVLGMAELLADTRLDPEQQRYVRLIQSNGETLLELINSILDLARLESGRLTLTPGEFDLREMLEQLLDALAVAAFEKQLELVGRISPGVPQRVIGDSFRLRQILTNLIGNAIKFTEAGQVLVRVQVASPGRIRFEVADTGIGIPHDKLKMVFEPFTQADSSSARSYSGSGLGLAIVSRLAGLMGGELAAESAPGKGSTFTFTVPLEAATASQLPSPPTLAGIPVMVVDETDETAGAILDLLAPLGATLERAASASDAIARLHGDMRNAIILLSGRAPGLKPPDLAAALKAASVDLSHVVMLLRSIDMTRDLKELRSAGLTSYVTKPVKLADLTAACLAAVGRARAADAPSLAPASQALPLVPPARLLMADDIAVNRAIVHDMLHEMPLEIDDAADGQEALAKVMTTHYDLVLMDMQMPVLDGYAAAAAIRKWERDTGRPRVPIVALTASALEADIRHAVAAGCDAHLAKPFKRKDLTTLLERHLAPLAPSRPS